MGGRPRGSTPKNRAQAEIANFINEYSGDIKKWMDEVYAAKGAEAAFGMFEKLIEYAVPKLSRAEVDTTAKVDLTIDIEESDRDIINRFLKSKQEQTK